MAMGPYSGPITEDLCVTRIKMKNLAGYHSFMMIEFRNVAQPFRVANM